MCYSSPDREEDEYESTEDEQEDPADYCRGDETIISDWIRGNCL